MQEKQAQILKMMKSEEKRNEDAGKALSQEEWGQYSLYSIPGALMSTTVGILCFITSC